MSTEDQTQTSASSSEYENQPVPKHALKGGNKFWGMYAGEHAAGTEFMIGPLFLLSGISLPNVIWGLLVGNLLAVLSWRYLCAPIATQARMTLYLHLEKIAGGGLVKIYNLANGILFCFLAGAMITVSATAVGIPFNIPMPSIGDWMPNNIHFVIITLIVGSVIAIVAASGYNTVSKFANIASPWMVLVFLACGFVAIKQLGVTDWQSLTAVWGTSIDFAQALHTIKDVNGTAVTSVDGLIEVVRADPEKLKHALEVFKVTSIDELALVTTDNFHGQSAEGGKGFFYVMFFAWFCNAAMHVGMADLSVFRYAKKASYGWASAAGMYVGHYMAWIAAAFMLAAQIKLSTSINPVPGPMANNVVGLAGIICVIVAGWTTANPTIYRAGLAFQAMIPGSNRFRVTLAAGIIATIAGIFPAFAWKLLTFVGLYGLILAPVGAIIVFDWHFRRRCSAEAIQKYQFAGAINYAVLLAWAIPISIALYLIKFQGVTPHYCTLPAWIACGVLYLLFSSKQKSNPAH